MISIGKSFKTNRSKNFITENEKQFNITIKTSQKDIVEIKGDYFKKTITLNNKKINKLSEHISFLPTIINTPEEAVLETKINKLRNSSIDKNISIVSRTYLWDLQKYTNILKQRNTAIKNRKNIEIWDILFIENALKIWSEKKRYNTLLKNFLKKQNKNPKIEIKGIIDNKEEAFKELYKSKYKEIERGHTIIGPHRDKIFYFLNNKEIKLNASQGEKTLFYTLLKKGEAELMKDKLKQKEPIILLDDILSKLDEKNKKQTTTLFKNNTQTIITHTEKLNNTKINQININD